MRVLPSRVFAVFVNFNKNRKRSGKGATMIRRNTCMMGAACLFVWQAVALGAAPSGRYSLSTNVVVDKKTGLSWQQSTMSAESWDAGGAYCAGLGALIGGNGWRLPTIRELQTIVDYSQTAPTIDPTAFPGTPRDYFWSASSLAGSSSEAWFVAFGSSGYSGYGSKGQSLSVRCVSSSK